MQGQKKGILYLIPTLLNEDARDRSITPYARQVVQSTTYYLAENLRTARRFISALELGIDMGSLHMDVVDKRTTAEEIPALARPLLEGHDLGLMSEAGCPAVADPGHKVVAWAHRYGVAVRPLVGPSSILLALMASGFNGQSFVFHGYAPIEDDKKVQWIRKIEGEVRRSGQTQIFMETPYRNNKLLQSLISSCHSDTMLCIAAGLTSDHELLLTRSIKGWSADQPDLHKIPAMFLMGTP